MCLKGLHPLPSITRRTVWQNIGILDTYVYVFLYKNLPTQAKETDVYL